MSPTSAPRPRLVVVGNVTEDLVASSDQADGADGAGDAPPVWTAGGPALYSARAAAALGADVTLVSRVPAGYDTAALEGLTVEALPAERCPRFENQYPDGGGRRQVLHQAGEPIANDDLPAGLSGSGDAGVDAVIAAPAFNEMSAFPALEASVRVVSLQGALRDGMASRPVRRAPYAPSRARALLTPDAVAIFSVEDADDPPALARELSRRGVAIVTRGDRGAWLYRRGARSDLPAFPAHAVDPTGAGDACTAAFAVRMVATQDVLESCTFAMAMGSLVAERSGLMEMPSQRDVEARMKQGR